MLFRATFFKYMNKRFSIMSRDYLKWYIFNSIIAIMGVQNKLGWIDRSLGPSFTKLFNKRVIFRVRLSLIKKISNRLMKKRNPEYIAI